VPVAATAAMASAPAMSEAILPLPAVTLVVAVRAGVLLLLRLRLCAAGYECGQTADILSAFMPTLARLRVRLRLMLRTVVNLLVARREGLRIAGQIGLLLRFTRPVARFVLSHERLGVIVIAVEAFIASLLLSTLRALLWLLLIVVRVLLAKLLLRRGDKTKIVFGMLVIIFRSDRIAGALRVTRKLDVFFRDMRSCAANFDVGAV